MKRAFFKHVAATKRQRWIVLVAALCVAILLLAIVINWGELLPMAPDGGGGDSPGVMTTTTAATTATIKDEPLATTTTAVDATGDETTDATTTTTIATSTTITIPATPKTTPAKATDTTKTGVISREPLPAGITYGNSLVQDMARAATEEELKEYQSYLQEKGWYDEVWCDDCGRPIYAMNIYGELSSGYGLYGTCTRHTGNGSWTCDHCKQVTPAHACHTCGVPANIKPLSGTPVNSLSQLTKEHIASLLSYAKSSGASFTDAAEKPTFVSAYTFVLTDNTACSSQSDCACFYVVSRVYPRTGDVVYHTALIFDLAITESGSLSFKALSVDQFRTPPSEAEAISLFEKIGHSITKIS